ncbi:PH domain-containing protein DDB_G0275795-like [Contarinia nasturtii]|uniref:PH domain-containing protein DDB_G0275795-like n=1 Tax=Contarinia nasturtii TaxID=265458 RepID=UPI0012D4A9C6|nr:PH domain-containing protein DDB_G0275795-like [Contarinia nasturtii]
MSLYCSYKDCDNKHRSFTSKTFFNLPNDERRDIWIKNSGNERLKDVPSSSRRVFCEDHFDPKYLRRQFNRALLRKEAIPYPYGSAPPTQEPDSVEIEYIEMGESEEEEQEQEQEQEQSQTESIKSSDEVVVLLNQMVKFRERTQLQFKQSPKKRTIENDANTKPEEKEAEKMILNDLKRKPIENLLQSLEDADDEINYILLEDKSQDSIEPEDNEPNTSKKIRIEIEQNQSNGISQEEKVDKIVQKSGTPIKPAVIVARNNVDGVVSSSETVDRNNEETYFALSLVGILKRLPPHKRAIAKCHILSYLTELEYGSSSLP